MPEDRRGKLASFGVSFGDGASGREEPERPEGERACRIVVVTQLTARPEWSTGRAAPLAPLPIDAESFDRVMEHLGPSLELELDDPFDATAARLRVDLVLRDRKSMRPREIAEQIPALRALVHAHGVLRDAAARKLSADAARDELARILPRDWWTDALVGDIRVAAPEAVREAPAARPAAAAEPRRNGGASDGLDALLSLVDIAGPPEAPNSDAPPGGGEPTRDEMSRVVAAVARSVRPVDPPRRAVVGSALQRVEGAFRTLLGSVLRHPEVRRLEAAWRGLRLLVEHCDARAGVRVGVLCAGKDAVADALSRLVASSDGSADVIVIDQHIEPTAADLMLLEAWARSAEALLAPVLVGGHPTMVGAESLEALARTTRAVFSSGDAQSLLTRSVAAREASRWVAVVLNDVLVRAAYTTSLSRQREPDYEEDPNDAGAHVFANGAYVVAALCARYHARGGWPSVATGAHDGGLGDLPVRSVSDRGVEAAIPLEVLPSDDAVREAAKAGFALLTCAPNSDAAVLARAPMLHRGSGGEAPATTTLADQLFVGRFARAVRQLAATIPAGTDPHAAEQVATITLREMLDRAAPPGPDIVARVERSSGVLAVTVRPHRFAGVSLEELSFRSALGGG